MKAFAALGDSHRRYIVEALTGGPLSVGELSHGLPISRPAVSRHLRILRDAGLVTVEARGARRLYSLDYRGASEIQRYMERVWGEALARFRLVAENIDELE